MCTLTIAWHVFEDVPVVVAANRDEYYDRNGEPPRIREWESTVVAPRDDRAGGTWMGYNEHGVFAGVTNRWSERDLVSERSRGLLVRDVLGTESAEEAARLVERELDEREYDGFNLLVADENAAILLEWNGGRNVTTLEPGVHVVVNVGANGVYDIPESRKADGRRQAENAEAVRLALQPEPGERADEWRDRAASVLADHEYGVCLHGSAFGTKSSSLVTIREHEATYLYAGGPPCETEYERVEDDIL